MLTIDPFRSGRKSVRIFSNESCNIYLLYWLSLPYLSTGGTFQPTNERPDVKILILKVQVIIREYLIVWIRDIRGGGSPKNFGRVRCSMGPQQLIFHCIFKKEFSEIRDLCCFMGPNFSRKNLSKIWYIFATFFQKINVLRFRMVSNGKVLKNFDEITFKTPHRLFLEKFL